jgi:hypothetical protein
VPSIYQHPAQYDDYECTEISKRIHGLDQLVLDAIREVALDPDLERLIEHELRAFQSDGSARTEASIAMIEEELSSAKTLLELREADMDKLTERNARDSACERVNTQAAEVARLEAQLATEHANRDSLAVACSAESTSSASAPSSETSSIPATSPPSAFSSPTSPSASLLAPRHAKSRSLSATTNHTPPPSTAPYAEDLSVPFSLCLVRW